MWHRVEARIVGSGDSPAGGGGPQGAEVGGCGKMGIICIDTCMSVPIFAVLNFSWILRIFIAPSHPHAEVTKLLCPHHEGAGAPHPIRARGAKYIAFKAAGRPYIGSMVLFETHSWRFSTSENKNRFFDLIIFSRCNFNVTMSIVTSMIYPLQLKVGDTGCYCFACVCLQHVLSYKNQWIMVHHHGYMTIKLKS